ncbi:F-box only protein 31-like isoform X2 [Dreissena polymorpha]|uniref:F-box only protein 31-like isoform X2 n=1 Tax=Dreissena polymorpha TaxID=45954 RepID=UPI0022641444|nr:F-box only protein 31-like isoform X2 [Dreissena polymorpha]XP_052215652.1 F-box only protein 31-like isoform X2 [Dreissena polymorpha]XP_052215658.1 F-box only protein 31-like isoform X2 [Dreissena polymorpha]
MEDKDRLLWWTRTSAVSVEPSSGISLEWHRRMYKTTTPCTINAEGCTPYERFSLVWHRDLNDESDEVDEMAKQRFAAECRLRGVQWLIHFTGDKFQNVNIQTQQFERLYLPAPLTVLDPLCPLREGLFKGMYSAHGTEIMLVTINWEKKDVSVLKISGDSNVPAGEVSVEADLSRPMLLTREQQITIEQVAAIDRDAPLPVIGDALTSFRQPFVIPTHESADMEAPDMCLCRYHALGTVSPTGYVDPQRIPVHFVVFDADTFGVIWIDLYHFSFYRRVHEELGASGVS